MRLQRLVAMVGALCLLFGALAAVRREVRSHRFFREEALIRAVALAFAAVAVGLSFWPTW